MKSKRKNHDLAFAQSLYKYTTPEQNNPFPLKWNELQMICNIVNIQYTIEDR